MRLILSAVLCLCLCLPSCVSQTKLDKYAAKAKEPGPAVFIVMENGEKIEGHKLRRKTKWTLDGKQIDKTKVKSYQDKWGYAVDGYVRVINGKLSMFWYTDDNTRVQTYYSSSTQSFKSRTTGSLTTTFRLQHPDGRMEDLTYNTFKAAISDCPLALQKLESEFKGTYTIRHPNWRTNHYPKLIKVLNVYNTKCL